MDILLIIFGLLVLHHHLRHKREYRRDVERRVEGLNHD
jgi:hypothetical protein